MENLNVGNENAKMLYTVKEAAKMLGVGDHYVYKLINKGLIPALKLNGLKIRIESLKAFTEKYDGMDLSDLDNVVTLDIKYERRKEETTVKQ